MRSTTYLAILATCLLGCSSPSKTAQTPQPAEQNAPERGGSIRGVIVDAATGHPISFVNVTARSSKGKPSVITTGSNGIYELTGLRPGSYELTAEYSDFAVGYDNVPVTPNQITTVDIALDTEAGVVRIDYSRRDQVDRTREPRADRHGSIRGVVRDEVTKEALPGAVVNATNPKLHNTRQAISDDAGNYLLPGLPPGIYTVSVYHHLIDRGNIEIRRSNVEITAGEIKVVDLDLDAETDI